jgi:predicted nuclease with TOPRIM domain
METITVKLSKYEALQERVKELTIANRKLSTALVDIGKEMQRLIDKNTALEEKLHSIRFIPVRKARFRLFNR